jgi:hypothetical protein
MGAIKNEKCLIEFFRLVAKAERVLVFSPYDLPAGRQALYALGSRIDAMLYACPPKMSVVGGRYLSSIVPQGGTMEDALCEMLRQPCQRLHLLKI